MTNTWVIVADGTRARFFNRHTNRQLEEFEVLVSPENRLHEGDLVSDRQGSIDTAGAGRHGMGSKNAAKEHEQEVFAKRVAARVEDGRKSGQLGRLILVAAPRFLGHVRSSLSGPAAELVVHAIDKDFTQLTAEKLADHLPQFI
ncbi:MAG: host attachment protein [Pseudomonadales bacterium]|nr:host attachment protein [Pseudomonadales bacterium]